MLKAKRKPCTIKRVLNQPAFATEEENEVIQQTLKNEWFDVECCGEYIGVMYIQIKNVKFMRNNFILKEFE